MDYQKFGKGFAAGLLVPTAQHKKEKIQGAHQPAARLRPRRPKPHARRRNDVSGPFAQINQDPVHIKWDLVSRMAAQDEIIHVFAKFLRGFEIMELAVFL